jgi:hypothetical protein
MTRKFIPVEEAVKEWRKDPEYVAEYDALEEEFALASALVQARGLAPVTQQQTTVMTALPAFHNVEACVAFFKAHPPEGETIEIEIEASDMAYLKTTAAMLECPVEMLITAIMTVYVQEVDARATAK